jgi:hypothetical protein
MTIFMFIYRMRIFPKLLRRKRAVALLLFLIVIPGILSCLVWAYHSEIRVGIVLEEGADPKFGDWASDGFQLYDDYFEPIVLPDRFDSSDVRMQKNCSLTKDFNDPEFSNEMRAKHDVHAILTITDDVICNWIDNPRAVWGEADPGSASAVMTVKGYANGTASDKVHVMSLALHEVLHLLGYMHHGLDDGSVMQYAGNGLNFTFYQAIELPHRVTVAPMVLGNSRWVVLFSINSAVTMAFIPFVIAIFFGARSLLSKRFERCKPTLPRVGSDVSISFFLMMIASSVFLGALYALVIVLLINLLLHFAGIVVASISESDKERQDRA